MRDAHQAFYRGDLATADSLLQAAAQRRHGGQDCAALDHAMVMLAKGDAAAAERILRGVRDRFDRLAEDSAGEQGLSLLTDDTAVAYAGEDYERILLRALLAVSNLMYDGSDAVAYSLQVDQLQREILGQRPSDDGGDSTASRVALGVYLRGAMQEESHLHYDDAQRSFATVVSWEPDFAPAQADLQRVRQGVHSAPGNGVVYVLAMVGRGPYKRESVAEVTSGALLIADQIVSATGDYSVPPTIAPVKIPELVVPSCDVHSVSVHVEGQYLAETQTVTDVGQLAATRYAATRDQRIARAVARRILKKSAVYGAKDALDIGYGLSNFALDAAGVLWEATERADTRCWALLPRKIQVLRVELPAGRRRFALRATAGGRAIGPLRETTVEVHDGRNSYVLASFPTASAAGPLLASH